MAKATQFLRFADDKGALAVRGESFDEEHLNEIDITGWNWDVEDPAAPKPAPNASSTPNAKPAAKPKEAESDRRPKPSKVTFTKFTDRATTRLLLAMDRGEIFPKVVLTIEERYQEAPQRFHMEVELSDAFLVGFQWSATAEGAGMTFSETWDLNYSQVHFKYNWRGDKEQGASPGVIDQVFYRPPEASGDTTTKSPLTPNEKRDMSDAQIDDYFKRNPQVLADYVKKYQRGK